VSWLLALGFVLANSIVYCVHYRTEMTEAKGLQIEAYERAQRVEALASAELNELRKNVRWDATAGCSSVTAAKSIQFCDHVREAQNRLQSAEAVLKQGRPGAKDAGADTLAWVLGVSEEKVRRSLPIFWAVILELMASLCMREAFATLRTNGSAEKDGKSESAPAVQPGALRLAPVYLPEIGQSQHFGLFAPVPWGKAALLQNATNDNMPLAAYA
jgi:hypothetical protein